MNFNTFSKGSGVYTCKCCGRKTRDTGDGTGVGMCSLCYDLAGYENMLMDERYSVTLDDLQNILHAITMLYNKDGAKRVWDDLIRTVIEICDERTEATV